MGIQYKIIICAHSARGSYKERPYGRSFFSGLDSRLRGNDKCGGNKRGLFSEIFYQKKPSYACMDKADMLLSGAPFLEVVEIVAIGYW